MRKSLRFAGHPLHPALAHVPVGAWVAVAVWDIGAILTGDPLWWRLGYGSLALGLAASVPAAAAGFVDFLGLSNGSRPERVATYHLTAMLSAATLYLASFLVRGGSAPPEGGARVAALALEGSGLVLLLVGGWLGGELVYRHGVGVRRREGQDVGEVGS